MYTEEEAKNKWCPMARVMQVSNKQAVGKTHNRIWSHDGNVEGNGILNLGLPGTSCIASDCGMWRWQDGTGDEHEDGSETDNERGYCGLAGRYE